MLNSLLFDLMIRSTTGYFLEKSRTIPFNTPIFYQNLPIPGRFPPISQLTIHLVLNF